jgi:Domain of unknown function (DUF4347)
MLMPATLNPALSAVALPIVCGTLVAIDRQITDSELLAAGVISGMEVVLIERDRDGIEQITAALAGRKLKSLHVVSHGTPGQVFLGNAVLSTDTLDRYVSQLGQWAEALTVDGELAIYGCEVAQGKIGGEFIDRLSALVGVKIAASSTKTGNAELGGDWNLGVKTREFVLTDVFQPTAIASYVGILEIGDTTVRVVRDRLDDILAGLQDSLYTTLFNNALLGSDFSR